ncbi:hypothetical protein M405DRAFT_571102 [Rhizopogon salebrosus TDB-379]|nr:hypothetical protein M405DRAFT_571102 [Rhizopogon salebrosus TDB-379]
MPVYRKPPGSTYRIISHILYHHPHPHTRNLSPSLKSVSQNKGARPFQPPASPHNYFI